MTRRTPFRRPCVRRRSSARCSEASAELRRAGLLAARAGTGIAPDRLLVGAQPTSHLHQRLLQRLDFADAPYRIFERLEIAAPDLGRLAFQGAQRLDNLADGG